MRPHISITFASLVLFAWAEVGGASLGAGYYREAGSYSTRRDPDVPAYASPRGENWDAGVDYRLRYEYRDDDIRRPVDGIDEPFLHRTRVYLGLHDAIDPLRAAVEVQDARRQGGNFVPDNRDFNQWELIRLYAEWYFERWAPVDPRGQVRPVAVRYGLHNFEFLDRRLIGNNQWRNTANVFRGLHAYVGQDANDWQVDLLAVRPMARLLDEADQAVPSQRLWAVIGHWRAWSEVVTLEPFYLRLDDQAVAGGGRVVHSPGLRAYGVFGRTGFDFDATALTQSGHDGPRSLSAWAANAEIGYRFQDAWKSRLSFFYGAASGDRSPTDGEDNRFERFFGFGRPWSANDYVVFENILAPKLRYEATVSEHLRFDLGYSWYRLESATDRFYNAAVNRDVTGASGDDLGHEFDFRLRWEPTASWQVTLGYAHFVASEWTRRQVRGGDTDFAYLELQFKPF
jgi:hypothetical protein